MSNAELYERDFFDWTQETAELIRAGRWSDVDPASIAEEIESLGKSDRRQVVHRLAVLITHLLKWQTQERTEKQTRSWSATIRTQRDHLGLVLDDSPSLRANLPEWIAIAYPRASHKAMSEMRLAKNPFPPACPFIPQQILDPDYWPE